MLQQYKHNTHHQRIRGMSQAKALLKTRPKLSKLPTSNTNSECFHKAARVGVKSSNHSLACHLQINQPFYKRKQAIDYNSVLISGEY